MRKTRTRTFAFRFSLGCALFAAMANGCTGDPPMAVGALPGGSPPPSMQPGGADGGAGACKASEHVCASRCVPLDDPSGCGESCTVCPVPQSGRAVCESGACSIRCDTPRVVCGGACVDLANDPQHCGECDRTCGAAACTEGRCPLVPLVVALAEPSAIAATSTDVMTILGAAPDIYFGACAKAGCVGLKNMVPTEPGAFSPVPGVLAAVGSTAYVMLDQDFGAGPERGLYRCTLAAGVNEGYCTRLVHGADAVRLSGAQWFAADAKALAWNDGYGIEMCELPQGSAGDAGCGKIAEVPNALDGITDVTLDDPSHVVWTEKYSNGVHSCTRPGCATGDVGHVVLAEGPAATTDPRGVRAFDGRVYWIDEVAGSRIYSCAVGGCNGSPTEIVRSNVRIVAMTVGPKGVYFVVEGAPAVATGALYVCRNFVQGCGETPALLASGLFRPVALTLDDQFVFVANRGQAGMSNGSIMKIAR